MQWTGKLIGAGLGAFLGPIGIFVGAAIGHQYDVTVQRQGTRGPGEQFYVSTFRVMGHVAKADGRVTQREIEAARSVMQALRLDPAQVRLAIALFTEGKDAAFDLNRELAALRAACHSQPAILRVFMEIQLRFALWGSDLSTATRGRVNNVANGLGIAPATLNRIEAALRGDARGSGATPTPEVRIAAAYRTLEVDATVSDAELVKSYRRLMSRHHPDKLKANGLPDSMLEHAKQRTQAIREAYELLRGQRGLA